jgi:hypothetical protein
MRSEVGVAEREQTAAQVILPTPVPSAAAPIYILTDCSRELRQSEIIANLVQFEYDRSTGQAVQIDIPLAIVLAQDCDLLRDYKSRLSDKPSCLNGVLLYELEVAAEAKPRLHGVSWQPVTQNINERFHFLSAVPPESDATTVGLPPLLLDFRRYFTLSPKEIYDQCANAKGAARRCRLATPYREHLQTRAAFYFQRIALP